MSRPSFPSLCDPRAFHRGLSVREGTDPRDCSPKAPSRIENNRLPELPNTSPEKRCNGVLTDADLDAFLPEEDELDPYPEPGDFWTGDA